jgi:hypothetical protein
MTGAGYYQNEHNLFLIRNTRSNVIHEKLDVHLQSLYLLQFSQYLLVNNLHS